MIGEHWRHKKRGTVYEVITQAASVQCATSPDFEERYGDEHWTVYQNVETGAIWVRLTEEFLDGRFERIANDK